jgi:glycosyltransferase involved in cell wall biosynthesis
MRLVIQIPCFNEALHIEKVLRSLPREVIGFDDVRVLVVDDGSEDGTAHVARTCGAHYVIGFAQNRGLSSAFQAGLLEALRLGADVIVNTDADNQYDASCIPALVAPIRQGEADIVVGDRQPHLNPEFSWAKRKLQRFGSHVVELAGAKGARDATSGFRAYSREAAMNLLVINRYTYTVESTIQAGLSPLRVSWVPVRTHPASRESRLIPSLFEYVVRNAFTIVRVFAIYRPMRFFGSIALTLAVAAMAAFTPFLRAWLLEGRGDGNIQSIILGAMLAISSLLMLAIGVLGDLIGTAREVSHRTLVETRRAIYSKQAHCECESHLKGTRG